MAKNLRFSHTWAYRDAVIRGRAAAPKTLEWWNMAQVLTVTG
jgi:hypothetical protein